MKKEKVAQIDVAKVIAKILGSRDVTRNLKRNIIAARTREVYLDFQAVDFVSRSAAHELLLLKDQPPRHLLKKVLISFINMNKAVSNMLQIVSASRTTPRDNKSNIHIKRISSDSLYNLTSV